MNFNFTKFQISLEILGLLLLIGILMFSSVVSNEMPQQVSKHSIVIEGTNELGNSYKNFPKQLLGMFFYVFLTTISFFPQSYKYPIKIESHNKEEAYSYAKTFIIMTKIQLLGLLFHITYNRLTIQSLSFDLILLVLFMIIYTFINYVLKICDLDRKRKFDLIKGGKKRGKESLYFQKTLKTHNLK